MQVDVHVNCMQANFGGLGLSSFRDFAPFYLPSEMAKIFFWTIVHGVKKIELVQNIYTNRGPCEINGNQFWLAWLLQFWRFCSFSLAIRNSQNFLFGSMGVLVHLL